MMTASALVVGTRTVGTGATGQARRRMASAVPLGGRTQLSSAQRKLGYRSGATQARHATLQGGVYTCVATQTTATRTNTGRPRPKRR